MTRPHSTFHWDRFLCAVLFVSTIYRLERGERRVETDSQTETEICRNFDELSSNTTELLAVTTLKPQD